MSRARKKIPSRKFPKGRKLNGKGKKLRPMTPAEIKQWFEERQLPLIKQQLSLFDGD